MLGSRLHCLEGHVGLSKAEMTRGSWLLAFLYLIVHKLTQLPLRVIFSPLRISVLFLEETSVQVQAL